MKKIVICTGLFLLLLSTIPLMALSEPFEFDEDNHEYIEWTTNTNGSIFGYKYDSNSESFLYDYFGHADGYGNIYLNEYHIPNNRTLIINEGVQIYIINPDGNFIIFGNLIISGSSSDTISIKHNVSNIDPYLGNFIIYGSSQKIEINYCDFHQFNSFSFHVNDIDISFSNCTFEDIESFNEVGTSQDNFFTFKFTDNTVSSINPFHIKLEWINNVIFARNNFRIIGTIWLSGNNIKFINNDIDKCTNIRLHSYESNSINILNNYINDAIIYIMRNYNFKNNIITSNASLVFEDIENTIISNNHILCELDTSPSLDVTYIDLSLNYWGTVEKEEIEKKTDIYDIEIGFEPYLDINNKIYIENEDNNGNNNILVVYITITILIVLFIFVVLLFLLIRRKKHIRMIEMQDVK